MKTISDAKALALQSISRTVKLGYGICTSERPMLSARIEEILSALPIKDIEHLELCLETLRAAKHTGEFPA